MNEQSARGPRTLFEKVWDEHIVRPATADTPAILYIDLHLIHEVTSPQAFTVLRQRGLRVRRPDRTVATTDHSTPTTPPGPDGRFTLSTFKPGDEFRVGGRFVAAIELQIMHPDVFAAANLAAIDQRGSMRPGQSA